MSLVFATFASICTTKTMSTKKPLCFTYTNYLGETSERRVVAKFIWRGVTLWHREVCTFLHAYDIDRKADQDFVLSGILIPVLNIPDEQRC